MTGRLVVGKSFANLEAGGEASVLKVGYGGTIRWRKVFDGYCADIV